ncbi:maleylpyruvate isomerase family mycothiol-dependent enzyme [Actinomadura macrotermitis]|uniref:Maleylpyruvate isomerase family mycothiol-dependent enzyme n=1 Tax=Actinomadura macrotermitis TaxID=2585200 RepID=A0A7K0BMV1_9ACTN|nr:maleylpyruvate isomerase family mycothiol-dependent enzyme [Actinomadura macrotermitis]MQY02507.1 hypothetical protein [Actinomadura macrotermitis]
MNAHPWEHPRYCDAAETEITAFGDAAGRADATAPVPSCPGWDVAELVRHLGGTHRWAGGLVRERAERVMGRRELGVTFPQDADELWPWYKDGAAALLDVLRGTAPDTPVWTWGPGGTAGWWARRMLHETAVHRADAELALGERPQVAPDVALDGIEELFTNLGAAAVFAPGVDQLRGEGETISFTAADAGLHWQVRLLPEGFAWTRADGPDGAHAGMRAAASDLYLFLWGRRKLGDPALRTSGDEALLIRWVEHSAV